MILRTAEPASASSSPQELPMTSSSQAVSGEASPTRSRAREGARFLLNMLGIVLIVFSARWSLADHYHVPTGSMRPNVQAGDHILVNKLAYGFRIPFTDIDVVRYGNPERGDVVVLQSPESELTLLKRVVALPGDIVMVRNGQLTINDAPVSQRGDDGRVIEHSGEMVYELRLTHNGGPDLGPIKVPDDHFLVMGDNRGESRDGRLFGFVNENAIFGQAVSVVFNDDGLGWQEL